MKFYNMKYDQEILNQIKGIIKVRPTYGYKRVTAMVNKVRIANSIGKINKKRGGGKKNNVKQSNVKSVKKAVTEKNGILK